MSSRSLVSVLCCLLASLLCPPASADPVDASAGPAAPRWLRVETSFFGGLDVMRGDRDVGPGFLSLRLANAVRGSAAAERHVHRATAWEATGLGLLVCSLGLLTADLLVFQAEHPEGDAAWSPLPGAGSSAGAMALSIGWLTAALLSGTANGLAVSEVLDAVNAYNGDLAAGRGRFAAARLPPAARGVSN